MLSRNTILDLAIHIVLLFLLSQCSNTVQPSIASLMVGDNEYLLTNESASASTGFTQLKLIDSKTSSPISFTLKSETEQVLVIEGSKKEMEKGVVFISGGNVSLIVSIDKGEFPVSFEVENYLFRNVVEYTTSNENNLALVIQEPRYPSYGVSPIVFLVAEQSVDSWKLSDEWKVNFVPWMNMGKKGHGSQFNVQPTKLDSLGLPWQKGNVSFSMPGEWDLRVTLSNAKSSQQIRDTLIVNVLDEEELEAILHVIPLMGR